MSLEYIRSYYKKPAYKGVPVVYRPTNGEPQQGIIVGAHGAHVMAKMEGKKSASYFHPADLEYLP